MKNFKITSFILGFALLFFVYHFPEFFQSFWIMAVFKIGFLILAYFVVKVQQLDGYKSYGLGFEKGWLKKVSFGIIIGLLFFGFSVFTSYYLGYEKILSYESLVFIIQKLPMILLMTFVPSLAEDILTRGYLYAHLKFLKPSIWILISSIIYVLNHIWRLNEGISVLSYLFFLGLVLAISIIITKSLWLTFGIHWGANIAFECNNSFINTITLSKNNEPIWILAITWLFLFVILIIKYSKQYKTN